MGATSLPKKIQDAIDIYLSDDEEITLASNFEDAFVGIARQFNKPFAVYDRAKCIDILINRDGMNDDEAEEYFQFNVEGGWLGETTPAYINIA
jgi:hypothetical protein